MSEVEFASRTAIILKYFLKRLWIIILLTLIGCGTGYLYYRASGNHQVYYYRLLFSTGCVPKDKFYCVLSSVGTKQKGQNYLILSPALDLTPEQAEQIASYTIDSSRIASKDILSLNFQITDTTLAPVLKTKFLRFIETNEFLQSLVKIYVSGRDSLIEQIDRRINEIAKTQKPVTELERITLAEKKQQFIEEKEAAYIKILSEALSQKNTGKILADNIVGFGFLFFIFSLLLIAVLRFITLLRQAKHPVSEAKS